MNTLRQIWYEAKHQPLLMWVSIGGTALAIFLVMTVFMLDSLPTAEVAPESNRSRILVGTYLDISSLDGSGNSSSFPAYATAKQIYSDINGVERISFTREMGQYGEKIPVSNDGTAQTDYDVTYVDNEFWNIFDFDFKSGKPFGKDAAGERVAVLQESVAENVFGKTDPVGKTVQIAFVPYRVVGVVADVSPLLKNSYSDIYVPYIPESPEEMWDGLFGKTRVMLLKKEGVSDEKIKNEVKSRYERWNKDLKAEGVEAVYHQQPFDMLEQASFFGSNNDPRPETVRHGKWWMYAILILLPAINISSMTRSRLRQRVSEIGVRRAFGATKAGILWQFLTENLVMTFVGAVLGMVLSVLFCLFLSNLVVPVNFFDPVPYNPTFAMLFKWQIFLVAVGFCLVLNILSTALPAWRASRENPAEAITGK